MKRRETAKHGDVKSKKFWDDQAKAYDAIHDEFAKTLGGKVDEQMSWEILKENLPEDKSAKILDAGGGTGRWTLPLVKIGYQVTLSDISSGLLRVAKEKLSKQGLFDRVELREVNITNLPFADDSFDFVLCWGGPLSCGDSERAASELVRVLRKGGRILIDAINRYYAALHRFEDDPSIAVKMVKSEFNGSPWGRVFGLEEFREMFEGRGIRVLAIYGRSSPDGLGVLDLLPKEIREAKEWSNETFSQLMNLMRYLNKDPSVIGMAGSLLLVGEKI